MQSKKIEDYPNIGTTRITSVLTEGSAEDLLIKLEGVKLYVCAYSTKLFKLQLDKSLTYKKM